MAAQEPLRFWRPVTVSPQRWAWALTGAGATLTVSERRDAFFFGGVRMPSFEIIPEPDLDPDLDPDEDLQAIVASGLIPGLDDAIHRHCFDQAMAMVEAGGDAAKARAILARRRRFDC